MRPIATEETGSDTILNKFQQHSIVDVMRFVNQKTHFTRLFEPILPRGKKNDLDIANIMAVILANAIRLGVSKMAEVSDLNRSSLLTTQKAYIREETLVSAINEINLQASRLPIFEKWYIQGIKHSSLDGTQIGVQYRNAMARGSTKYFPLGTGVSTYNQILNSFPIAGRIIGSHEYEGNFTFGMVQHQTPPDLKPRRVSKDMHGINALNFALFDFVDIDYMLRFPKPHNETFWGIGDTTDYQDMIIHPTKMLNVPLFENEWDNVQRFVASILSGTSESSVIIRKVSNSNYKTPTKQALMQYNNIVRTEFLLRYLADRELQRSTMFALNRGEAYNALYKGITLLRKGEFRGLSEIEVMIWNQCTRLISSIILYYNTYILNSIYVSARSDQEKQFIVNHSPCAWTHINLLGHYEFCHGFDNKGLDAIIKNWDWQKDFG